MEPNLDEIEVVCSNCSFPTVTEYDEDGKVSNFYEEEAPKDIEAAMAEGWIDHGMGLVCPKCSLSFLEDLERDRLEENVTGANGDITEIVDGMVLRDLCPKVSQASINEFVKMFRSQRLAKLRARAGLPTIGIYAPVPKDDDQAQEFIAITDALERRRLEKEGHE